MLKTQTRLITRYMQASDSARRRHDDRGEVTSQVIVIAVLVLAAVAAGAIISTRIGNEASKISG